MTSIKKFMICKIHFSLWGFSPCSRQDFWNQEMATKQAAKAISAIKDRFSMRWLARRIKEKN